MLSLELTDSALDQLMPYLAKSKEAAQISEADAPFFLKEIVQGILVASQILAQANLQASQSRNVRKRAEAVAYLEKYPEYIKANNLKKGTVAEIEAFVTLDEDVIRTQDREAYYESLATYLANVRQSLVMSHDDVKKAVYSRSLDNMNRTPMLA